MESHLVPGDPILVENIVRYFKAMGIFDEFRHECMADVDTKVSQFLKTVFHLYINFCHRFFLCSEV